MKFNEEINPKGEPLVFASVYQNYLASAGLTGGNRPNTTGTTMNNDPDRFKKMVTNLAGSNVPDWATSAPQGRKGIAAAYKAIDPGVISKIDAMTKTQNEAATRERVTRAAGGMPYAQALEVGNMEDIGGGVLIDYGADTDRRRRQEAETAYRDKYVIKNEQGNDLISPGAPDRAEFINSYQQGAQQTRSQTPNFGGPTYTATTPPPKAPPPTGGGGAGGGGTTAPPPPPPPVAQPPDYRDQGEAGQRVARSARTKFSERRQYRDFSVDRREELAEEHKALPDGSFPIVNSKDLHNAVSLHGKAKDPARAKSHIITRAKSLGLESELPDTWNESGGQKIGVDDNENKGYISALQEGDMDEEVTPQQFAEMQEHNASLQEQVNALNTDRRLRMFSDIVLGKGGQNDGTAWLGGPDRHVPMLELLSRAFGEDSDAVTHYIETNNSISQQFAELAERSGLFSEVGLSSPDAVRKVSIAANGTLALPESIANAVRTFKEEHPELDDANAQIKFFSENPDAYAKYNSDHMRRSKEA